MKNFYITDSQYNASDIEEPSEDSVIKAVKSVYNKLCSEDTWVSDTKFNYNFWVGEEDTTIFCNAFPVNNDKFSFYYEIKGE